MRLENRESLAKKREDAKAAMKQPKHRILVCAGTGCLGHPYGGKEMRMPWIL